MKALKNIFPFVLLCVGLSSCLDDEYLNGNSDEMPNVVEFGDPASVNSSKSLIYPVISNTFEVVPDDEFEVTVSYSGTNQAPEDIVVNVAVDQAALNAYNAKIVADARAAAVVGITDPAEAAEAADDAEEDVQEDLFDLAPTSVYSLSTNQVTIKKGERAAKFTVKVKPNMFDFAFKYGIPLTLSTNQATVSGNFGTVIFQIGAKNEWEGEYSNTFSRTRVDGSVIVSGTNTDELLTTGATSLKGHLIGYYSNEQHLSIDPATNKVTVTSPGIAISQDVSYYDPATKTFHIQYVALNTTMKSTLVRK